MDLHFILFAACAASIAQAGELDVEEMAGLPAEETFRIVGGEHAEHGEHPWMVSLFLDTFGHICGASVLNENWVITAAHCIPFVNEPRMYYILVGLHKMSMQTAPSVQKIQISKIVLHEDYNNETLQNDIALLKTATPIDIAGSEFAESISLPTTTEDPTGNATILGWGLTSEDGEMSDILREVTIPIIPRNSCNAAYDDDLDDGIDVITEKVICAGMKNKDACSTDSGGPLFQTNNEGVSTLIGVISFGTGCEGDDPGVYTKVSSYLTWIENVISQ